MAGDSLARTSWQGTLLEAAEGIKSFYVNGSIVYKAGHDDPVDIPNIMRLMADGDDDG